MNRKFLFLVLLSFSLSCISVFSETLEPVTIVKHFGAEDGLLSKTVYSIVQDKDGFVWIATDAGAFRYDGNEYRHYTVEDGLSDNEILRLFVDSSGKVWFLTYNGYLSYYFHGKFYNTENTPFLKTAYLGGSIVDAIEENGKIWFCYFKRGFVTITDTIVEKILLPINDREMSFPFLTKGDDGSIWYFKYKQIVNTKIPKQINLPESPIAFCSISGNSDVLYLTSKSLYRMKNLVSEVYIGEKLLPDFTKVVTIFYEKDLDNLWICTFGKGCYLYHNKKFVKTFLPNSSVTSIMRDSEGNVWIGTMNEGAFVYYKNNNYITNYDKSSGLSDNKVFSLATDRSSNLWLGFYNGDVCRISDKVKTTFKLTTWNKADFLRTMSIIIVKDTVWCGNDGGIYYIVNDKVGRVFYPDLKAILNNYSVKHLMSDKNGNVYGAFAFNLLKVEKTDLGFYGSTVFDSLMRVFASIKTDNGELYVSTITGLIKFFPGKYLKQLNSDYDFSKVRILDFKFDDDGSLILATNVSGVFVMKDDKIVQHITTTENLSDNNCRKLFLRNGKLYVCTQNGLNVFKKKDDKWFFNNELSVRDGLLDNSINDVTVDDSLIYIATDGGVSIVNRNVFDAPHYIRDVYISEVVLDKRYQIEGKVFSFDSKVQRFIVKYSYPVFNPANKIKFRYRLRQSGENAEWISTTNNEIQFSSLNPGSYLFEVMPDLNSKVAHVTTLGINVRPMWWQTILAKMIFALIILIIVTVIIKQSTKMQFESRLQLLRQKQLIETERNRIASDMHDDIGADLTQISIWSNVLKSNTGNTKTLVDRISSLSNEVLSKMDQIIWALNSIHNQSGDLVTYIHSYAEEYLENNEISLEFVIGEKIPDLTMSLFQRRNIFLVIKELLHNTVKHSNATSVGISVYFDNKYFCIDYSDNGKGFIDGGSSDGLGLGTMEKRMKEINSIITIVSEADRGMKALIKVNLSSQILNV